MASFSETYCDTATGANINAGDDKTVSTTTNGAYTRAGGAGGTDLFTAASGTPFSGASTDDLISVYADGATVSTFIARITAVNGGGASVDISLTKIAGTRPATAASGVSATIGGKWKGPNAASGFPLNLSTLAAITNTAGDIVCVNMKGGTNYAITAVVTLGAQGPYRVEGYTTTVHDGGRATIDGGTSGASYNLFAVNGNNTQMANLILQNNGATGGTNGVQVAGSDCVFQNIVVNSVRGTGFATVSDNTLISMETYACNQSNGSGLGGISMNGGKAYFCICHDNTGSNSYGMRLSGSGALNFCIADTNGGIGFDITATVSVDLWGLVAYKNTSDGIKISAASATAANVVNCILQQNGAYGINASGSTRIGNILNCAFGAGTEGNTSGNINAPSGMQEAGTINLTSNISAFVDAPNGDFDLNNTTGGGALLRGTGYGTFTQTASSYTGTSSKIDVGAAQHQETASGGGSFIFGG